MVVNDFQNKVQLISTSMVSKFQFVAAQNQSQNLKTPQITPGKKIEGIQQ